MKNSELWRALGRNTIISMVLFGALLGLLWLAEMIFPSMTLLKWHDKWHDPAWVVGIPASIIGVAYILTIRDPHNYTGFYAGIIMSILLGIQFILQGGYDSAFLFFLVFIPFQMMSIYKWSRNKEEGGASFEPKFLDTPRLVMSIAMLVIITAGDYVLSTFALMHDGLTDNMPVKILNGLLISSSFLANYWLIYRKTDSWIYWFIYSVAGIGLFIILGNVFSIVLFTFFLVINSMAGLAWIKGTSKENLNWVKIEPAQLMDFLLAKMGGMAKSSVKQLLGQRRVKVGNAIQTRHDFALKKGDVVTVSSGRGNSQLTHPKLKIVYEDDDLIVVNKQPGLLTVAATPGSSETTAYSILRAYVKKQNARAGIYVVHRLDRETSGLLVFARSEELQHYMREYWRELVTERTYIALAEGVLKPAEGKITTWLTEDKRNAVVYSSPVDDGGDIAITNYKTLRSSADGQYSLVELHLETGRTNQIRVHLASKGCPVVGDRKYGHGNEYSPIDRLCLHAKVLAFIHPVTEKTVRFESPVPKEFNRVLV